MTLVSKLWQERPAQPEAAQEIATELGVMPLTARVLANRLEAPEQARDFLHARLNSLPDPDLLPDMEVACTRLAEALARQERIAVHGDYDVDGITGTALLVEVLRSFGAQVEYHIPLRMQDGYGLSSDAIRRATDNGCTLLVSVDCGVSAHAEAELVADLGLDLIVTDHHQPPDCLPDCLALINPHLSSSRFPFPHLAGVGVAFFLLLALRRRLREDGWFARRPEPDLRRGLDLVALGTIADMVPLGGVNRVLVRFGLQLLDSDQRSGVEALKRVSGVDKVTCGVVGFRLAPRLNAAGRLEDAALGVQLLLAEGERSVEDLAAHLESCNRERQQVEADTLEDAVAQVEKLSPGFYSLVLADEGWHPGVIGIVASRLVERYYRPTVLISLAGGTGKGSARSIHGFHLFEALGRSSESLDSFGGHAAAAGLSLSADKIEVFREAFEATAREALEGRELLPQIAFDGHVELADLPMEAVRELASLAPFGIGNPQPVFVCRGVEVAAAQVVGERHLRFRVLQGGDSASCIAFGMAERLEETGGRIDLLFRPEINSFRGRESVQFHVVDFLPVARNA